MLEKLKRSYYKWKAYILLRGDVVHEHEVDGLTHRFLPASHENAKAQYRYNRKKIVSSAVQSETGKVIETEKIDYYLYEFDVRSAESTYFDILHTTLHELTHWAMSSEENEELDSSHSHKWADTFEGVINYVNSTSVAERQAQEIAITLEKSDD